MAGQVVFDEHFSSVNGTSADSMDALLDTLFETAKWASSVLSPDSPSSQYHFDTFWSDDISPESSMPHSTKKRIVASISPSDPALPLPTTTLSDNQAIPSIAPISAPPSTDPPPSTSDPSDHQTQPVLPSKHYPYAALIGSIDFQSWKRRRDINRNIHHCPKYLRDPNASSQPRLPNPQTELPELTQIFQAALDHGLSPLPPLFSPEGDMNSDAYLAFNAALQYRGHTFPVSDVEGARSSRLREGSDS